MSDFEEINEKAKAKELEKTTENAVDETTKTDETTESKEGQNGENVSNDSQKSSEDVKKELEAYNLGDYKLKDEKKDNGTPNGNLEAPNKQTLERFSRLTVVVLDIVNKRICVKVSGDDIEDRDAYGYTKSEKSELTECMTAWLESIDFKANPTAVFLFALFAITSTKWIDAYSKKEKNRKNAKQKTTQKPNSQNSASTAHQQAEIQKTIKEEPPKYEPPIENKFVEKTETPVKKVEMDIETFLFKEIKKSNCPELKNKRGKFIWYVSETDKYKGFYIFSVTGDRYKLEEIEKSENNQPSKILVDSFEKLKTERRLDDMEALKQLGAIIRKVKKTVN